MSNLKLRPAVATGWAVLILWGICGSGLGCTYVSAAISPMNVEADKTVTSLDPGETHIEARSSESSHISGRNNLTFQAAISDYEPGRLTIEGLLLSTTRANTDPNNFYVYLNADDQVVPVTEIGLGEVMNRPYSYTYTYSVDVEAGQVRFDDGSTATVYERQQRTGQAEEDYYSRPVTLVFEHSAISPSDAEELMLEIRDLGVNMTLEWNLR